MNEIASDTTKSTSLQSDTLSVDAFFAIESTDNGVYLVVTYEKGAGAPIVSDFVAHDLYRRGITGLNLTVVLMQLAKREPMIKLAGPQNEMQADADIAIKLSPNEMDATMMLFPPVAGGNELDPDVVLGLLRDKLRIVFGLDEHAAIHAVSTRQYLTPITVARGREAVRGKDGKLTILFNTEHSHAPRILEDGSADYKNLDIFESTLENDILAVITPPEDGIEGMTVTGRVLSAAKGKPSKLPKGRNTRISEDGMKLLAAKNGRVEYAAGLITVSDVLTISGDVDMSIGNIDFPGDVEIRGNVISGLTVQASGNIEIRGTVEAASIIAGKNIVLKTGIQSIGKGMLQAGGDITARFIEKSTAFAKRNIIADYIGHSTVTAVGSVLMNGKYQKIVGSTVRAGKEIIAKYVGANTVIEIGVSPEMRGRLAELENRCAEMKAQIDKIESVAGLLPTDINSDMPPFHQKLIQAKEQLDQDYAVCSDEIWMLRTVLSEKSGGRVHVTSTIEQDVKLIIDSAQYILKSSIDYVTFKSRDGELIFGPCEKSLA